MEMCSSTVGGVSSVLSTIALPGKKTLARPKRPQKAVISCTLTQPPQLHNREDPVIHSSRRGLLGLIGSFSLGTLLQHSFSSSSYAEASTVSSCDFTVAPSGLAFCDISLGSGLPASKGMTIKANYVGKLEDGKVFDSSYDRGKPFTFKVGIGQVIKGWDEGILGGEGVPPMLAGGKRTLRIPSSLGYGERGAGCRGGSCLIPPNSVLLFDVEFIGKAY